MRICNEAGTRQLDVRQLSLGMHDDRVHLMLVADYDFDGRTVENITHVIPLFIKGPRVLPGYLTGREPAPGSAKKPR